MASAIEVGLLLKGTADMSDAESKLGGLAKAAAGAVAGFATGKAVEEVVNLGVAFDDVYDGMAIATGKTGEELEGLQESFRTVASQVPVSFEEAGAAVTAVSVRLGDTGGDVDALSIQMANLSRMTGTDVTTNVNAAADVLGTFGVSAADQSKSIDLIFAASQQAGIGFDAMSAQLTKFSPQMNTMGLSLEQGASLLTNLNKAGLDAGPIMKGMTKFASDGGKAFTDLSAAYDIQATASKKVEDAQKAYDQAIADGKQGTEEMAELEMRLTDAHSYLEEATDDVSDAQARADATSGGMMDGVAAAIEQIKNTADPLEQAQLAMDLFGKKGGEELVLALQNGTLSVETFTSGLTNMGPGINDTAASTDDMQQKFDLLKNKVKLAAEGFAPYGMALQPISGMIAPIAGGIGAMATKLPLATAAGKIYTAMQWLMNAAMSANPIGIVIIAIVALVAIFVVLYKKSETVRDIIDKAFGVIKTVIETVVAAITAALQAYIDYLKKVIDFVIGFVADIGAKFGEMKDAIAAKIEEIKANLTAKWDEIKENITTAVENVRVMLSQKWDAIKEYLSKKIEEIRAYFEEKWEAIRTAVSDAIEGIRKAIDEKIEAARKIVEDVMGKIRDIFDSVMEDAKKLVSDAFEWIRGKIEWYIGLWKTVIETALKIGQWLWDIITGAVAKVKSALADLADKAIAAGIAAWKTVVSGALKIGDWIGEKIDELKQVGGVIWNKIKAVGSAIIDGFKQGITDAMASFTEWFGRIFGDPIAIAKKILGIGSPSKVFAKIGEQTIDGFREGIESGYGSVRDSLATFIRTLPQVITTAWSGGGTMTGGGTAAGRNPFWQSLFGHGRSSTWDWTRPGGALPIGAGPALGGAAPGGPTELDLVVKPGQELGRVAGVSLLDYIKSAPFGGILGNSLSEWMRARGFDEETIEDYRDLHRMREGGKWKTREAMWLHRRRTILTGGDWTGASAELPGDGLTDARGRAGNVQLPGNRAGNVPITAGNVNMQIQKFSPNITISPTLTLNGTKLMTAFVSDQSAMGILWEGLQAYGAKKVTVNP